MCLCMCICVCMCLRVFPQAVARSYEGRAWEGVMPVPWDGLKTDCKGGRCTVVVPAGSQYRVDAFEQTDKPRLTLNPKP